MAKTGSTAIQMSLHAARDLLLENGVLYPDGYLPANAHHLLTALFRPPAEVWPHLRWRFSGRDDRMQARARENLEAIRHLVDRHAPGTLVLSSEMFFDGVTTASQQAFRDLVRPMSEDIDVCLYIRPPAAHYLSALQQRCKTVSELYLPRPMAVREAIGTIEAVFGRRVIVRPFEPEQLHDRDVVRDFVAGVIGRADLADRIRSIRANESISAEAMSILAMTRRVNHAGRDMVPMPSFRFLRESLDALSAEEGAVTRPRLRPGLAGAIERASTDLLWLRDRYGLEFGSVDYGAIDGTPLEDFPATTRVEDLCVVDPDLRDRMLYRLLQKGIEAQVDRTDISTVLPVKGIVGLKRRLGRFRRRALH